MYVLLPECPTAPERNVVFLTDGGARSSVLLGLTAALTACPLPTDVCQKHSRTLLNTLKLMNYTTFDLQQVFTFDLQPRLSVTNRQVGARNPHTYHLILSLLFI